MIKELFYREFTDEFLEEKGLSILKVDELEKGKFYFGECRNSSIAMWSGDRFYYIRSKFGDEYVEGIEHVDLEKNVYTDSFVPVALVEGVPKEDIEFLYKEIG